MFELAILLVWFAQASPFASNLAKRASPKYARMVSMTPRVVILISPPGGGKGTQADFLQEKFGFYHLESAKVLEEKLIQGGDSGDPEIKEARRLYKAGELVTSSLVMRLIIQEIEKLYAQGKPIVFSGSFRTLEEAPKELSEVARLYGKENVKIFFITLSEEESVKRNSGRRICQASRHPIPNLPEYKDITICPRDGSPIVTRELDKPEIIKKRYQVFLRDTEPVLKLFKDAGYEVITVNGEQPIEKVSADIAKFLT